jgi:hypothetical protein
VEEVQASDITLLSPTTGVVALHSKVGVLHVGVLLVGVLRVELLIEEEPHIRHTGVN